MPDAETSRSTQLNRLDQAIRGYRVAGTSDDTDKWPPADPAGGQCGVTTLTAHELLDGGVLIVDVFRQGNVLRTLHSVQADSGLVRCVA